MAAARRDARESAHPIGGVDARRVEDAVVLHSVRRGHVDETAGGRHRLAERVDDSVDCPPCLDPVTHAIRYKRTTNNLCHSPWQVAES